MDTHSKKTQHQHHNLRIIEATTFFGRLKGLVGNNLQENQGLFFRNACSLHTFFMGYTLDIIYLNKEYQVLKIARHVKPWRISTYIKAKHFIEIPSQRAYTITVGDYVDVNSQIEESQ